MLKRLGLMGLTVTVALGFGMNGIAKASGNSDTGIDEKYGQPIVVVGSALSASQKAEVEKDLGVDDASNVEEITVTGDDLVHYIPDGNRNSHMYSSAKITRTDSGGVQVHIVTPDNITEVTADMYKNALLTAGVQNADIEVASPLKVTGHSALVGIYKAYDDSSSSGDKLDSDRTKVASQELNVATDLAQKEGLSNDQVTQLLTEIKQEIAAQHPATKEDIEKIVDDKLKDLNINLTDSDRQLLYDLFDQMRKLNINFDSVKSELGSLSDKLSNKIKEAAGDKGFWQSVQDFFKKIFDAISNLFQ
ncbi:hypothetical protein BpJC7_00360 [Weizmannia acidilactici]|uniref:DUF1002 domain-containing protein n=1 Tax=Weizmannia acidilactici TaxID=2607726 RepID=A0A5J4JA56_9BACI|nr:DUF1002 domain-containing protein [Weizmannia acidilactici]GER67466.1 hypothetical protein BpJC4_19370 [Weizmannia acidilactici]GER68733.1 hypothetical protein BpJC7_00360 [Weizmannia acidilactici]GER74221.1 hypothetical protein BpPP18_22880 [Weizmannia acidilactici]